MSAIPFLLALLLVLSIVGLTVSIFVHAMKTAELNTSVSNQTTVLAGLGTSVDAIVDALGKFKDVTPDADVVTAIVAIDANTAMATALKAKLDAALTP